MTTNETTRKPLNNERAKLELESCQVQLLDGIREKLRLKVIEVWVDYEAKKEHLEK
jgi:hypothetical protein